MIQQSLLFLVTTILVGSSSSETTTTTTTTTKDDTTSTETTTTIPCGLYLVDEEEPKEDNSEHHSSYYQHQRYALYMGRNVNEGELIMMESDLMIPILDKYKTLPYRGQHRWLSWFNYVRGTTQHYIPQNIPLKDLNQDLKLSGTGGLQFQDDLFHLHDVYVPGIASLSTPAPYLSMVNIELVPPIKLPSKDSLGMNRNNDDFGLGSFTQHVHVKFRATKSIKAGSKLYYFPSMEELEQMMESTNGSPPPIEEATTLSTSWLQQHGYCMDNSIYSKRSTIKQAGYGAFAKHSFESGQVISSSPLAVLKREDLIMYQVNETAIRYSQVLQKKSPIIGHELLLNYVYGHDKSDLLFLPLSPMVNYINHYYDSGSDDNDTKQQQQQPNAMIRWTKTNDDNESSSWLKKHPVELLDMSGIPIMEIVATRRIDQDDEILLDYGISWQNAWNTHVKEFKASQDDDYISAFDYMKSGQFRVRTIKEQQEQDEESYPSNLQTVCMFLPAFTVNDDDIDCWLPCHVVSRTIVTNKTYFTVRYEGRDHSEQAKHMIAWDADCLEPPRELTNLTSRHLSQEYIGIMDKYGTTDQYLSNTFRHEMGVVGGGGGGVLVAPPACLTTDNNDCNDDYDNSTKDDDNDSFFPTLWKTEEAKYKVAYPSKPLQPGEFIPIKWSHNGKPVTRNAFFVGLPKNFTTNMRQYCEDVGAMDHFRNILVDGNYNDAGDERNVDLKEHGEWYIQRPLWNSNMHWIIPWNETARQSYLHALGTHGFDDVLDSIGTGLGMKRLTCFHNTFLGISESDDSNLHADFYETQRSSWDFLIPLVMANYTTKPELDLQSLDGNVLVGIKYQYGMAVVLGDYTYHKSAMIDYMKDDEFRVVSSIYCSQITPENRDSLLYMYNEEAPAPFHHLFDIPIKEWHWDTNKGRTLPKKKKKMNTMSSPTSRHHRGGIDPPPPPRKKRQPKQQQETSQHHHLYSSNQQEEEEEEE